MSGHRVPAPVQHLCRRVRKPLLVRVLWGLALGRMEALVPEAPSPRKRRLALALVLDGMRESAISLGHKQPDEELMEAVRKQLEADDAEGMSYAIEEPPVESEQPPTVRA